MDDLVEQQVALAGRETGQLDIEIDLDQLLEMLAEYVEVPHRLLRQPVVGDHDGPLVGGAEAGNRQRRDLGHPETLGSLARRSEG